jgi:uncharacterized protein YlxW (UPF0749 family)
MSHTESIKGCGVAITLHNPIEAVATSNISQNTDNILKSSLFQTRFW